MSNDTSDSVTQDAAETIETEETASETEAAVAAETAATERPDEAPGAAPSADVAESSDSGDMSAPEASEEPATASVTVDPTPEAAAEVAVDAEVVSEVVAEAAAEVAAEEAGEVVDEAAAEVATEEKGEVRVFEKPRADRPAISAPKDIGDVPDDLTADDFAAAVEQTVFEFKEGDIVAGTVVRVDPDEVLVDIGYKSEGVIPPYELSVRNNSNPLDIVTVGDEIEALVLQKEDDQGRLVLSKKRAQYERAWAVSKAS